MFSGTVSIPFSGYLVVDVDNVLDENEAWEQAVDRACQMTNNQWNNAVGEVAYHWYMNRGNVCVAVLPEADFELEEVLEYEDDEDETPITERSPSSDPGDLKEHEDFAQDNMLENDCE